jgi:hypothetical protein
MQEGGDEMRCHSNGPSLGTLFGPGWPIVSTLVLLGWKRGVEAQKPSSGYLHSDTKLGDQQTCQKSMKLTLKRVLDSLFTVFRAEKKRLR